MRQELPHSDLAGAAPPSDPASLSGVRDRLFEAGIETMARRGYHGTTTRDITKRANVSPAGLYVHFPSKEHLLFAISRFGHALAVEAVHRARRQHSNPADRLTAVVTELAALHAEQYKVARVAQYDLAALSEEHLAEIRELRHALRSAVRATIQEGVDEGSFCCDVPGTALAVLSMCVDIARWFDPAGSRSARDLSTTLASIATRMVSANPAPTIKASSETVPQ
jgi:AcrR family transcriptional regulator